MSDLRRAAEMALEALEAHADIGIKSDKQIQALRQALRTALAQPEQVLTARTVITGREWVGLTDEEIKNLWNQHEPRFDYYSFSCDIEAKLKEKNT
jgi:3-dehydroquinate dehydratase